MLNVIYEHIMGWLATFMSSFFHITGSGIELSIAILIVLGVSVLILLKKDRQSWWKNAPALITTLGIFCTFVGVTIGLMGVNPDDSKSINKLLDGLKLAFVPSAVAIFISVVFKWLYVKLYSKDVMVGFLEKLDVQNTVLGRLADAIQLIDWQMKYKQQLEINIDQNAELLAILDVSLTKLTQEIVEKPTLIADASANLEQAMRDTGTTLESAAQTLQQTLTNLNLNITQVAGGIEQQSKNVRNTLEEMYGQFNNLNHIIQQLNGASKNLGNDLKAAATQQVNNIEKIIHEQMQQAVRQLNNKH